MPNFSFLDKYSKKSSKKTVYVCVFESPVGEVIAAADNELLYVVTFEDSKVFEKGFKTLSDELSCNFKQEKNGILNQFEEELKAYLNGDLKKFSVPIKTYGSDFQKEVWNKLLELPYASTMSYGDLAKAMGRPGSHARAVGAACGANSHLVVVPCHRLVGSTTKGGFNSGVDRKEWLLQLEKEHS
ncbi:methylated-DNA--protein-cysteine methyltransferase [Cydia amplana]|uniref:methylated-DNA--protein-cysteine methyltransferase n=1 Tax=Cydia amplana TaxID=1869771 RepID=UPI002FE589CD